MADPLSDILRALRLRGTVYFQADFAAPWGMDFAASEVANFHFVVSGQCVSSVAGEIVTLGEGDLVVFPHGARHRLAHSETATAMAAQDLIEKTGRLESGRTIYGGDGETSTLVCGHFELERQGGHPLLDALPQAIYVRGNNGGTAKLLTTATQLAAAESRTGELGSAALVDRLAEILLIEIIRAHAGARSDHEGFLAALSDGAIARSLQAIHASPARAWTVDALAREVGMSRSTFSELFRGLVGQPPIRYLTLWRMHRGRELLATSKLSIADVAERVGYESEFAFAKAYKRTFSEAPGRVRKRVS